MLLRVHPDGAVAFVRRLPRRRRHVRDGGSRRRPRPAGEVPRAAGPSPQTGAGRGGSLVSGSDRDHRGEDPLGAPGDHEVEPHADRELEQTGVQGALDLGSRHLRRGRVQQLVPHGERGVDTDPCDHRTADRGARPQPSDGLMRSRDDADPGDDHDHAADDRRLALPAVDASRLFREGPRRDLGPCEERTDECRHASGEGQGSRDDGTSMHFLRHPPRRPEALGPWGAPERRARCRSRSPRERPEPPRRSRRLQARTANHPDPRSLRGGPRRHLR